MKGIIAATVVLVPASLDAQPFHDPIPEEFRGTFAPTLADCRNEDRVDVIEVGGDGVHYYEGDDYLIIGVKFSGSSTKSGTFAPLFNGRFTGRMETQLLGEVNARMEMETPDTLIRYAIKDGGEVDPKPVNIWVRCPKAPRVK